MNDKRIPTLRYFARFRNYFGNIRAVIRYQETRKTITTPLVITREQLTRLDTSGHIIAPQTDSDHILEGRLRNYTAHVWNVFNALMNAGTFNATPSADIAKLIQESIQAEETDRAARMEERAAARFRDRQERAKGHGVTFKELTPQEFAEQNAKLKSELTPEQYAALWNAPEWDTATKGKEGEQ